MDSSWSCVAKLSRYVSVFKYYSFFNQSHDFLHIISSIAFFVCVVFFLNILLRVLFWYILCFLPTYYILRKSFLQTFASIYSLDICCYSSMLFTSIRKYLKGIKFRGYLISRLGKKLHFAGIQFVIWWLQNISRVYNFAISVTK